MRREFKTLGVVLRKKKLKGKDLLVVLFTKDKGKLSVLAKGVQKITSRRLSHLDTGNLIKARITEKNEFFYLSETVLVSGFSSIKESLEKATNFFLILKIFEKIAPEAQQDRELFQFLLREIKNIDKGKFSKESFLLDLARISGVEKSELEGYLLASY